MSEKDPYEVADTPEWVVHRLLDRVKLTPGLYLDPCAGSGGIMRAMTTHPAGEGIIWHAIELRANCLPILDGIPVCQAAVQGNFLLVPPDDRYVAVVGNPPFSRSFKFVQHALLFAPTVIFLLRLNWLASSTRSPWLRKHMPNCYVLPQRPSFYDGGTDRTEYAWFVFSRNEERRVGSVEVLDDTPASKRRPGPKREDRQQLLFAE